MSRRALSTAPATPLSAAGKRATIVCWSGDGCGGAKTTTPALSMETPHAAANVPASSCKHSTLPPMRFRLFDAWAAVGKTATTRPTFLGNLSCKARAAAQASKRRKRIGGKVECLHDAAGTFAQACGVDAASAGVVVLAPPHPSPDQHTIVARFPAALDGVAGAVESALRDKGVLPAVRRTG